MKLFFYSLLLTACTLFSACQKEISWVIPQADPNDPKEKSPLTGSVTGLITDENDQPLQGAAITVSANRAVSNAKGYFRFDRIGLDKYSSLVQAEAPGYFTGYRVFSASPVGINFVKIRLLRKTAAGTINSSTGGTVIQDGHSVSLPANAVVLKSSGQNYNGQITVLLHPVDPVTGFITATLPGSLLGIDTAGKRVALQSFGMMAVELEGAAGEKLQIMPGKTANLGFPIPASLVAGAPAQIPLWFVDDADGLWKQEGAAIKNGNGYTGAVSHFSFWNCDIGTSKLSYIDITVLNTKGGPIPHIKVSVTSDGPGGSTTMFDYTDSTGYVGGLVPSDRPLTLKVWDECGVAVYSRTLQSVPNNTSFGRINISLGMFETQVSGVIKDCSNNNIANGFAEIYMGDKYYSASVMKDGRFNISVAHCGTNNAVSIRGVDVGNKQAGPQTSYTIGVDDLTNLSLAGCGNPIQDYQVTTIAGDGQFGFVNGIGTATRFNFPNDVVFDAAGNLFVADAGNHAIRKIDPAGTVTTFAGNGSPGHVDGPGASAFFNTPCGIAIDQSGNLFIAENYGARIRKVTPAGIVSTIAGDGTQGYADGPGSSAKFNMPVSIIVDPAGNLFVADRNHAIRKITASGMVSTVAGGTSQGFADGTGSAAKFSYPKGMAFDASGDMYIADNGNNRIRKMTAAGVVTTYTGISASGLVDGPLATARFYGPNGLAIDSNQDLYVADGSNYSVRKISNGNVRTIAGGSYGYLDGIGTTTKFDTPIGIAVGPGGILAVADFNNLRIRKLRPL